MTAKANTEQSFWSHVAIGGDDECWPFFGGYINIDGYGVKSYNSKLWRAHRLAWYLTNDKLIPKGAVIRHVCDNPICCNPSHLQIGTQQDNISDRVKRNRNGDIRGERHPLAVLNEEDIRDIRASSADGATLGRLYGVTRQAIWRIRNNRAWRHI